MKNKKTLDYENQNQKHRVLSPDSLLSNCVCLPIDISSLVVVERCVSSVSPSTSVVTSLSFLVNFSLRSVRFPFFVFRRVLLVFKLLPSLLYSSFFSCCNPLFVASFPFPFAFPAIRYSTCPLTCVYFRVCFVSVSSMSCSRSSSLVRLLYSQTALSSLLYPPFLRSFPVLRPLVVHPLIHRVVTSRSCSSSPSLLYSPRFQFSSTLGDTLASSLFL